VTGGLWLATSVRARAGRAKIAGSSEGQASTVSDAGGAEMSTGSPQ
jgi:hypothetical protein